MFNFEDQFWNTEKTTAKLLHAADSKQEIEGTNKEAMCMILRL